MRKLYAEFFLPAFYDNPLWLPLAWFWTWYSQICCCRHFKLSHRSLQITTGHWPISHYFRECCNMQHV